MTMPRKQGPTNTLDRTRFASLLDALPVHSSLPMLDHLPDVHVFMKDRDGLFIWANQSLIERLGLGSRDEIIGTTDYDRYPPHLADRLAATDREVMQSGEPLLNYTDILFDETGSLVWFGTWKYPLRDASEKIVGIMGMTIARASRHRPDADEPLVQRAIQWVRDNPGAQISVADLAAELSTSSRKLNRLFKQHLGIGTQEFILRNRIHTAARLLRETDRPLASIAADSGFYDQSAFTRQFRKRIGMTPLLYRRKYRI